MFRAHQSLRRRSLSVAHWAIILTTVACAAALVFRTPLRARYWAWRLSRATSLAERSTYLTTLCQLGPAGRWGVSALLDDSRADVRQYGVLVLQHLGTDWAREKLLEAASDADSGVCGLAALALAQRGDDAAVPVLKWLYQTGDESAAATACAGLARLSSLEAITALNELTLEPKEARQRSALVDALGAVGRPDCVPGLVNLLGDEREYSVPPSVLLGPELLAELEAAGYRPSVAPQPTTRVAVTIAHRAAAALGRITGLALPCESAEERRSAAEQWSAWYVRHVEQ